MLQLAHGALVACKLFYISSFLATLSSVYSLVLSKSYIKLNNYIIWLPSPTCFTTCICHHHVRHTQ